MARTLEEIAAALRAEYPTITDVVNGQAVRLDAAAYTARIGEWAANVRAQELEAEAEEVNRQTRRQVRLALAILEADADRLEDTTTALSAQQLRNHLARTDRILVGLIRVLIDRALVEDEATPARVSGAAGRTP